MKIWFLAFACLVFVAAIASVNYNNAVLETKHKLYQDCIKDYTPGTELHVQAVRSCALMAETQTKS